MMGAGRGRPPGALRRLAVAAAVATVLALVGCSEEPGGEGGGGVAGKTPVVRPEDVHGPGGGRAAVLAPDYRQNLAAGLETAPAPGPARQGVPAVAPVPAAGSLVAPGPAPGAGTGPGASGAPTAAAPDVVASSQAPSQPVTPARPGPSPGPAGGRETAGFPSAEARQLVLVTAADMSATRGTLRRLTREQPGAPWREAAPAVPCQLGRKGLGVGRGLVQALAGPAKRQGDGRTPAGLFPLPAAFGAAGAETAAAAGVRLPYVAVTDRVSCITEASSPLFGRVVGPGERPEGGLRQDRMARDDGANVWGVVIGHNSDAGDPGAGTCLFVNVRPAGGPPTGGSIGIPSEQAAALAAWLDPSAKPLLAVLPEAEYRALAPAWGLP
ncbi:hypothetical protein [Solidesulfovibrio sp.]